MTTPQCVTYSDGSTGPCDAHDPRRGRQPGLYIVFDGPPGPEGGRLIEVEDESYASVSVRWRREGDQWALGPFALVPDSLDVERLARALQILGDIDYPVDWANWLGGEGTAVAAMAGIMAAEAIAAAPSPPV